MTFRYTNEQLDFLRANRTQDRRTLAGMFNKKFGTEKTEAEIKSLCKRRRILTGRTGQFERGNLPWCAGKTGVHQGNATSFKKGQASHNKCPVGAERLTTGDNYVKVKVAEPNVWEFKHLLLWRQHHGEIPENHAVVFIDNDRSNIAIENLQLISRAELLYLNRNGFADAPAEIRPTAIAIAKLAVKTFEATP
jgi:hypothetical protein